MTELEFHNQVDELLLAIEDAIEETPIDIDYVNSGGVLTLTFTRGNQIILSRQTALNQLWVAARCGGFHFDFDQQKQLWICDSTQEQLVPLLNRCASEQAGQEIVLDIA